MSKICLLSLLLLARFMAPMAAYAESCSPQESTTSLDMSLIKGKPECAANSAFKDIPKEMVRSTISFSERGTIFKDIPRLEYVAEARNEFAVRDLTLNLWPIVNNQLPHGRCNQYNLHSLSSAQESDGILHVTFPGVYVDEECTYEPCIVHWHLDRCWTRRALWSVNFVVHIDIAARLNELDDGEVGVSFAPKAYVTADRDLRGPIDNLINIATLGVSGYIVRKTIGKEVDSTNSAISSTLQSPTRPFELPKLQVDTDVAFSVRGARFEGATTPYLVIDVQSSPLSRAVACDAIRELQRSSRHLDQCKGPDQIELTASRGQSLWRLAEQIYGDGRYYRLLKTEENNEVLNTGDQVEARAFYRIGEGGEHVVQYGESLWSIAEAEFGDGRKYVELAKANGIEPSAKLFPLTELRMPSGKSGVN